MDINAAISSSTSDEWEYLAEGGAHLVFAYRGSSSFFRNKVIRVRKDRLDGPSTQKQQETLFDVARDHLSRHIIPALVPYEILPSDDRVTVSIDWIRSLLHDSVDRRPASRLSARSEDSLLESTDTLDNAFIEVSLVENLLGGVGDLAVEIKVSRHFAKRYQSSTVATTHPDSSHHSVNTLA